MNVAVRPILLAVCVTLVGAACGGSDDDPAATTDSGVTMAAADDEGGGDSGGDTAASTAPGDVTVETVEGIAGIEVYENLGRDHVDDPTYDVRPPPGGDHLDQWESCGFISDEVQDGNAVHSLEHGAVWAAYRPDLDDASVQELEALANVETHLLVSPYPDLEVPLMLVAWGLRLPLDSIDDERFDQFLAAFIRGPQTPEPGVACRV